MFFIVLHVFSCSFMFSHNFLRKSLDFKDESLVLGFFINKNIDFNYKGFKKEYYDDKIDLIVKYGFSKLEQAEYEAEELVKNDKRLLSNKYL